MTLAYKLRIAFVVLSLLAWVIIITLRERPIQIIQSHEAECAQHQYDNVTFYFDAVVPVPMDGKDTRWLSITEKNRGTKILVARILNRNGNTLVESEPVDMKEYEPIKFKDRWYKE